MIISNAAFGAGSNHSGAVEAQVYSLTATKWPRELQEDADNARSKQARNLQGLLL